MPDTDANGSAGASAGDAALDRSALGARPWSNSREAAGTRSGMVADVYEEWLEDTKIAYTLGG